MKRLYFFAFFVLNFILTFSSKDTSVKVNTRLNLINPTKVAIQKMPNEDALSYKLDNSKGELVKVYIKELENNGVKLYNEKNINGKLSLNSKKNKLKGKVTVRVMYN